MASRRNGQELGQALHDAQKGGLQGQDWIQGQVFLEGLKAARDDKRTPVVRDAQALHQRKEVAQGAC